MTDPVQLALIASIAPTLAALAAMIVSLRNGAKSDVISAKADVIHALTNDTLSKATNALAVANETIKGQQAIIATLTDAKKVDDLKSVSAPNSSNP